MATPRSRRPLLGRRSAALLPTLLLGLVLPLVLVAGPARAADGYRYWNYFHVSGGKYVFAQTGPGDYRPKDGAVEAYRYGLSSVADGIKPRTAATTYTVDEICSGRKAGAGQKRVGLLIDYGTAADSGKGSTLPKPRAACAVVPSAATGQQVLDKVAKVRVEKQQVCGIDGYPVSGCAVTVKNPPAATREPAVAFAMPVAMSARTASDEPSASDSDDGGSAWPIILVAAAVVVLGGGALVLSRRGKNA
jgi:hypothetical protein